MSVAQICKEVDRQDNLNAFEKEQQSLVKKRKRTALDRFKMHLVNNLVRDKKFDFNETINLVDQEWLTLREQDRAWFEQADDFDLKHSPDKKERALARKKPEGPVKLQIKYQYKDSGMALDGYCFFA